jgi:hypothetical protein
MKYLTNILILIFFWVAAMCSLTEFTNVSEVLAASIIRVMITHYFNQTTQSNNPEYQYLQTCYHEILKSHNADIHVQILI